MVFIPNINNFAKLYSIPAFRVDQEVIFTLELCDDFIGDYGDIIITADGQEIYKQGNIQFTTYTGDLRLFYITMPANTLGTLEQQTWSPSVYSAQVNLYHPITELSDGVSNSIILDVMMGATISVVGLEENPSTEYIVNSSIFNIDLNYIGITKSIGGKAYLNSYQIELYYANDMLEVYNSGVLFDWNNYYSAIHSFTITKLKDNTKYFLKVKATAINGYQTESPNYPFTTRFTSIPSTTNLTLTNEQINGCVKIEKDLIGITGTRIIVSRTLAYANNWMTIKEMNIPINKLITIKDYYALAKRQYVYKLSVYNGDIFVTEYLNNIIHEFSGIVITDKNNHYSTEIETEILPIQKNVPNNIVVTHDNIYPFYISNGITNYYSGSCSGIFSAMKDECNFDFENSTNLRLELAEFLSNRKAKLLKSDNGMAWLINVVSNSIEKGEHEYLAITKFEWDETGDKENIEEYIRLGLL